MAPHPNPLPGVPGRGSSAAAERELFARAVDLRRRILFSHPALDFDRLLLSKRPPPVLSAPGDNYYGMHNGTGPGLVILDQWKTDRPKETVLLAGKLPPGCAMHADVSFDGRRIVFAYADHTPPRDQWQFFLYEIHADGTGLRQITGRDDDPFYRSRSRETSDARPEPEFRESGRDDGGRMTVLCEDYDPCYLPDGGIAFISTRNQGGVRCHNGDRYCPTYLLYRCDADGSNIRQLSFGEANEWDPVVMPDGQILWTRWDYINRPVIPTLGLWTIRPDGTAAGHYFGNYTPNPCRICQTRPIPGSHKVVATTAGHHTIHAGALILIDRTIAEDGLEAITRLTPEARFPESEGDSPVSFGSPYPLSEDLFLAEFCPDPYPGSMASVPRHNAYGIYLVDTLGGRELIYRDPEISCFEPLPVRPRPMPPALPSVMTDKKQATGVFYLQDVYRSTQGIPRGTIRRLRVNELIPQPTQRVPYSSAVRFEVLKRVLGTVPVDDSGSVAFEAPAGVPLQFQALDQDGLAVMTMRTFTHVQPGEVAGCVGCHEPRTSSPVSVARPASGGVASTTPGHLTQRFPCRAGNSEAGAAGRPAVSRRPQLRQDRPAGARPLLPRLPRLERNRGQDRSARHDRRHGGQRRQCLPSLASQHRLRSADARRSLGQDRPIRGRNLVQPAEGLFRPRRHAGPTAAEGPRERPARPGEPPADHRLARSERSAVRHVLVEQGRVAAAGSGRRTGAAGVPSPAVRRRVGRATVCGAGERGLAGGEPHPESAAGDRRRRLGPDRAGRLEEHRRSGVPEAASTCASRHPALALSRHRRHLRPRRELPVSELLGPPGAGRATTSDHRGKVAAEWPAGPRRETYRFPPSDSFFPTPIGPVDDAQSGVGIYP